MWTLNSFIGNSVAAFYKKGGTFSSVAKSYYDAISSLAPSEYFESLLACSRRSGKIQTNLVLYERDMFILIENINIR